jgi:hypothetical protein
MEPVADHPLLRSGTRTASRGYQRPLSAAIGFQELPPQPVDPQRGALPHPDNNPQLTQMWRRSEPWLLEVFGLALVLAHSPSLVEAFGGPTPISLAEFRAGGQLFKPRLELVSVLHDHVPR